MILRRKKSAQFNALRSLLRYICGLCSKCGAPQQQHLPTQQQEKQSQQQEKQSQPKKLANHYENTNIWVDAVTCESYEKSFVLNTNLETKLVEVKISSLDKKWMRQKVKSK